MLLQATGTRLQCCPGAETGHETLFKAFAAAKSAATPRNVEGRREKSAGNAGMDYAPALAVPLHRSQGTHGLARWPDQLQDRDSRVTAHRQMLAQAARLEGEHALDSRGQGAGEGVVEEVQLLQRWQRPQRGRQRAVEVVAVRAQQLQRRPRCTRHTAGGETPSARLPAGTGVALEVRRSAVQVRLSDPSNGKYSVSWWSFSCIPAHMRSAVHLLYAEDEGG